MDPNECAAQCEAYFGRFLGGRVDFVRSEMLPQSTRSAPWRVDIKVNGVSRSLVLRLEARNLEHEYRALRAMASTAVPTAGAYGWDPEGEALGVPCFFSDYLEGESLRVPMLAGEAWAEEIYLDTVSALQGISREDLGDALFEARCETAADVLEDAQTYFQDNPRPLAERAYEVLKDSMPVLPEVRFSNGDLWLDNFMVRDRQLLGVLDFENAGFSDPIFEFLLSFFVSPALQGRGLEQRYCRQMGYDPAMLHWYHGLECFDTLRWVLFTSEPFVHHTVESLETDLKTWLDEAQTRNG